MILKIFNTLTKKKEYFQPKNINKVKIYVCGITVYDLCHLGHARTFAIFDTVIRFLKHCRYQIKYVRNITDIDDKIIQKAHINKETIDQLTCRLIQNMHADLDALNILRPNYEPKVTNYINIIIDFIKLLILKKHAYVSLNGDVVFSLKSIDNYGILSRRVFTKISTKNKKLYKINTTKQNPQDFVLWKSAKTGEPFWIAPWGKGRPGWHIECSAIRHAILGNHIDIHGGGSDLIFPHHDNEIVQSICAYDASHVNIWMHSGMLSINNNKMSKSLNNFLTISESLNRYDPETVRFFLLSAHYRSQLQYNDDSLKKARASLEHLYIALRGVDLSVDTNKNEYFLSKFISKMNDDFNTPEAYSVLFEIAHELNILKKNKNNSETRSTAQTLKYLANILGVLYQNPEHYLTSYTVLSKNTGQFNYEKIKKLIQIREHARKNNQWEAADKIRIKLKIMGIIVEDDSTGKTKWRYHY